MRVLVYSTHTFDRSSLSAANKESEHEILFSEHSLSQETCVIAEDFNAVCLFVNDQASRGVLTQLAKMGVKLIALRSAGFNHVDLVAAEELGLTVLRVPAYSPHAVAEHTIALILTLNRKTHRAYNRVREQNFSLDGLLGFDLNKRTVGIIGTGKIGGIAARILSGFGCKVLIYDLKRDSEMEKLGASYVSLEELLRQSDIISLHCPLNPKTYHLINQKAFELMKPGVMLINTGRGALIDTTATIAALKSGKLGYLGLDVYEEEGDLFFRDLSEKVIQDDMFMRLMSFPNVLITAHQAFFTRDALDQIARTTIQNLTDFESGETRAENKVTKKLIV